MASTPGYLHDLFVSYSWADNARRPGQEMGWVKMLAESLEVEVRKRLRDDRAYDPWIDSRLSTQARITPAIREAVQGSATLLVVLSESYLGSAWCQEELELFLGSRRELAEQPTIFLLNTGLVDRDQRSWPVWSKPLQDLRGRDFWQPNKDGHPMVFGYSGPDSDFDVNVVSLSYEIAGELKTLAGEEDPRGDGGSVYLSEVQPFDYELRGRRTSVAEYLDQSEIDVRPASAWPMEPDDVAGWLEREMQGCDAFVQLLGAEPVARNGDQCGTDLELAHARRLGLPILRWRRENLDPAAVTDPEHRRRLEDPAVRLQPFEELKSSIVIEVARRRERHQLRQQLGQDGRLVFLDGTAADHELAADLQRFLADSGVGWAAPELSEDLKPGELREALELYVETTAGSLLLYGRVPHVWVQNHLLVINQMLARDKRQSCLGLVKGPPDGAKQDLATSIPGLREIDCRQSLDERVLGQFLASLGGTSP